MHVKQLIHTLRSDLRPDTDRGRLVRSAAAVALLKTSSMIIAFLASLLYARSLGPSGYGLYAYVMAWVAILTIPANLGLPAYLVREGSKFTGGVGWLLRWSDKAVCATGLIAAALLACASLLPKVGGARWLFVMAAPLPAITNLGAVRQALLQARGWVARSQWPPLVLTPTCVLIALLMIWLWRGALSATELMGITVVAAALPWGINSLQLHLASGHRKNGTPVQIRLREALPFMWLDGLYLVTSRTDLVVLGALKGAHEAGVYAVAMRAAEFVPFFLTAANIAIGPKIARFYQASQHESLQRLTTAVARRVLFITTVIGLTCLFGATQLISLFYGPSYAEGATVLRILAAIQTLITIGGPVGVLLNMTAHADLSAKAFAFSAGLNIALNILLVPAFGMAGAATATATSIGCCAVIRWRMVRRHLHLSPSALGF